MGLIIPGRQEFFPTHVRLLIDLYLKRLSDKEEAHNLFLAFEKVYGGEDPQIISKQLNKTRYRMQLDDVDVNLYYGQLLMIEQEFNYIPREKLESCLVKVIKRNKQGKETVVEVKICGEVKEMKVSDLNPAREFLMRFIRWIDSGEEEVDKIITNAVRNWPPPQKYGRSLLESKHSTLDLY